MDNALLMARLLVGAVFLVAGFAKLRDRQGTVETATGFGLPAPLAPAVATLLPLAELAAGAALMLRPAARYGAAAALVLLGLFLVAIVVNLRQGRRPDCHCFGQLGNQPIGSLTVVRNLVLAGLAGFVAWQGSEDPSGTGFGGSGGRALAVAAWFILLGVVLLQGSLLVSLLRQNGRVLLRLDQLEQALSEAGITVAHHRHDVAHTVEVAGGLPVGTPAPPFSLRDVEGAVHTLDSLLADARQLVLVFSDTNCAPCATLMPDLASWEDEHRGALALAVLSPLGKGKAAPAARAPLMLIDEQREVSGSYRALATPSAVVVRHDGVIGSPLAAGVDAVRHLLVQAAGVAVPAHAHGLPAAAPASPLPPGRGEPLPPFALPDLEGRTVSAADLDGGGTVVLFWNPGCAFCQQMLPDLKQWETRRRDDDPRLLVVSTGTVEANLAMNLHSTVVVDPSFEVGRAVRVPGTPSAVLVDGEGKLASELAVGVPGVMALLRQRRRWRRAG